MSASPGWLPPLIVLENSDGDVQRYLDELYSVFYRDFRASRPVFMRRPIVYDNAISEGKEEAFWHIISEKDAATGQRNIDPRRCERIGWVRAIIDHADDPSVSKWHTERRHRRVLLWLEKMDYLVVLEEMANRFVFVTAYYTDYEHARRKLRNERKWSQGKHTPPKQGGVSTPPTHGR